MPKPTNYGFIPQTLDEDGDELDALIITDTPLPTGIFLEAKVIGVMKFVDDGEWTTKSWSFPPTTATPATLTTVWPTCRSS